MRARGWVVALLVATACGSERQPGAVESSTGTTTTDAVRVSASTTLGPVVQQVQVEGTLPAVDGPAMLWRVPALSPDPGRLARWAQAFGFTEQEIGAATGTRIARDTPDGQVLTIYESMGRWVFMDGPAGMFAVPGSCPLPAVAPPSTIVGATTTPLPPGQRCTDPPPSGVPDPAAAEEQARSLWEALGIDVTGTSVTVGGDEYLREVIASDDLDGMVVARLRVVIGAGGRLLRATGSVDAPVVAGPVPRVGLADALDRFARQLPGNAPGTTAPASFDGVYRVIGAVAGLTTVGDQWLVPTYEVSLADGRTITLLAIDLADIPKD